MGQRIIIMAGGTGGHVFPALAVAQYLAAKDWDVSWIGTKKGMESRVIPAHGIEIDWLSVQGLRGKSLGAKVNNASLLLKAFWQAFKILRKRKPDVVLGMGGYVAGPGGLMASFMGIPLIIHEQNRVPGTTNRLLVNKADKVLEAFPGSFLQNVNAIFTGNPLRAHFVDFPEKQVWTEESERELRILVVGGSLGAKILNDVVPVTVAKLENMEIKHQTGTASIELVSKKYAELQVNAQTVEFIEDIASAYQWADLVICRAGAMTVSEIAAAALPAIFIPLPHAIDDHQTANAKYLVDAGAGLLLAQSELNEASLIMAISKVKESLKQMGVAAKNKAKVDATAMVANICIEVAA
ncbi:MAG: undecaprenyldiphospho-muramoylpentapeptide beta-N-acetylglucosaminyltransferase [Methylococcaceae bacterium]|nr:undecaprenyldiphospho-muramoylpentapeptide beta-N-acetylglucosaminyltransferase [Methylococcaceae bacterium]